MVTEENERYFTIHMATQNNTTGMLAYLLSIFTGFIGPLVVYLTLSEKKGPNYENAKNALNFQFSVLIYSIVSMVLMLVLIGFLLIFAVGIFNLVICIIGTVKANNGEVYAPPLTINFIK